MILFWSGTYAAQLTATELSTKIIQTADTDIAPKESLIQWYYSVDDLATRVEKLAPSSPALARLLLVKTTLRQEIDTRKALLTTTDQDNLLIQYKSVLEGTPGISDLCKNQYEITDDWAYALNLPTSLILATWDMEASCRRYKPWNGNGIFQITANNYGSDAHFTTGHWIVMMYDYAKLVEGKINRYHNANKLSRDNCPIKDLVATGQIAPLCLSYGSLDMDSIIKYGALYNGLSGATVKGNIQPGAPDYVFGKFGPENQQARKDGLVMRILKVLDYKKKDTL